MSGVCSNPSRQAWVIVTVKPALANTTVRAKNSMCWCGPMYLSSSRSHLHTTHTTHTTHTHTERDPTDLLSPPLLNRIYQLESVKHKHTPAVLSSGRPLTRLNGDLQERIHLSTATHPYDWVILINTCSGVIDYSNQKKNMRKVHF